MDTTTLYSMLSQRAPIHTNHITDCVIWDGELDRLQRPVMEVGGSRVPVRNWIASALGQEAGRGITISSLCENVRCVKVEHFEFDKKEVGDGVDFTEEELSLVKQYVKEGYRQENIAERMQTSRSRISRMAKVLKERESNG